MKKIAGVMIAASLALSSWCAWSADLSGQDATDLRQLAAASAAVLGSVARDARDQARTLVERRRASRGPVAGRPPSAPRRRWRFKKRWVVVPVVTVLVVVLAALAGAVWLVLHVLGLG